MRYRRQLVAATIATFIVSAALLIGTFIRAVAAMAGRISHLSGFWWVIGGVAAYAFVALAIFSVMKIAALSDERIARSGGSR